ncbi:Uncharacterized copper-binding protein, cupredoxin-like subfamily [Cribrihabitans marinus]|uniref:Uncharacterized copper-binding protein, cupredoxin-like subfamily n=2 Tax=Cribrihabitans marinus TaxID=1227549 RepID=A0A1H6QNJ1_9RHOB|nr:hypothetical protein GCM10010973_01520 [Cribrihabitans marinus]SEI41757.1 Uncharacterized copper-binding protein, cupredoxin-like subfamily [Cribrihabitans marinus]
MTCAKIGNWPTLAVVGFLAGAGAANASPGHGEDANIGQTGDISHIDREIEVELGEMYFDPDDFEIEKGETVKFVLTNVGRVVHEFAIATDDMHDAHANEMRAMMKGGMMTTRRLDHDKMRSQGMMHTDANARLLEPGEATELVWTFSGDAEDILIACNVPGHRAGGMEASIVFTGDHS